MSLLTLCESLGNKLEQPQRGFCRRLSVLGIQAPAGSSNTVQRRIGPEHSKRDKSWLAFHKRPSASAFFSSDLTS
jgi:hypothetical protein